MTVPGGCHSQSCHGYPTRWAQFDLWLYLPFRHHSPSSSIVDRFNVLYQLFFLLICRQGHLEMVVYLMKQGADPASLDIEGSVTVELSLKKCIAV